MSKHTPGPWSAIDNGYGDYKIIYNEAGNWIAEVFDDDEPVSGRTEADARLIAAAPELLEACERAEWWLTTIDGSGAIRSVLRAAIDKAKGK